MGYFRQRLAKVLVLLPAEPNQVEDYVSKVHKNIFFKHVTVENANSEEAS